MTDATLNIRVDSSEVQRGKKSLDDLAVSGGRAERGVDGATKSTASLSSAARVATGVITSLGLAMGVREVVRYADEWQNTSNRLRLVTKDAQDLASVQRVLIETANDTRAGFAGTAELFTVLTRSTKDLNLSQQDTIDLTKTINQSFAVSGASAAAMDGAIRQLAQGLQSGALRGDEFNSIAEQAPGILDAVAESLKMGRGELRDFAATGGITSEVLVKAIQDYSDVINSDFSKAQATFGQSMTIAKNNMLEFVGSSQAVQSITGAVGSAIVSVTEVIASMTAENEKAIEIQRLLEAALDDGLTAYESQEKMISQVVEMTNALLKGKANLIEMILIENGTITDNAELLDQIDRLVGKQARSEARRTQILAGMNLEEQIRANLLKKAGLAQDESTKATDKSTEAVSDLREEYSLLFRAQNRGRDTVTTTTRSIEAQEQATLDLIQSLQWVPPTYAEIAAMGRETTFVMQGVTASTVNQTRATEFWTKVSEQGAQRRGQAEQAAARAMEDNWQRTHEFVTNTILDIADNGGSAFERLGDVAVATAKRIAAEWLALKALDLFGIKMPGSMSGSAASGVGGSLVSGALGGLGKSVASGFAGGGGITGAIVGNGTAGSGLVGAAASIPGWGWALGGAAVAAKLLDSGGTMSGNAGFLIRDTPGAAGRTFDVPEFASGFKPVGFARREDQGAAAQVIDTFRQYDAALTNIAKAAGLDPRMTDMSFGGFDEKGQGGGLFFGSASEDGKNTGTSLDKQIDQYVSQYIKALPLGDSDRDFIMQGKTADEKLQLAGQLSGVPGYATGGYHDGGWRIVGEKGPELEYTGPSQIYSANDTSKMLSQPAPDNSQMLAEMRGMFAEMRQMACHTKRTSDLLTRVTRDGDSLVTVAA